MNELTDTLRIINNNEILSMSLHNLITKTNFNANQNIFYLTIYQGIPKNPLNFGVHEYNLELKEHILK